MQIFTTEHLPVSERIAWWTEVVCDYALDVNTSIEIPDADIPHFRGKLTGNGMGSLGLVELSIQGAQSSSISRDLSRTRRADDEFALLNMQITGSSIVNQAGRTACMRPGDMVLYDSRLPHNGIVENNPSSLLLRIPRAEIIYRVPYLEEITTVLLDPRKTMTRLVHDMMLSLNRQLPAADTDNDPILADAILDAVTAAVTSSFRRKDSSCSSSGGALLWRVKSFIDHRLLDSNLSSEQIASAHGVTVRYLNQLFAKEDTSITRWICKRRLEKCAEILSSSWHINRNIHDIAYLCGFNSISYFYHSFKQRYGYTPREYRLNASIPRRKRREPLVKSEVSLT